MRDVGEGAKGYQALALNGFGQTTKVSQDVLKFVHDKKAGTGPRDEVGSVLYTRGMIISMLTVEAIRTAQEKYGKGKAMTGEQVRWGYENLNLTEARLKELGFDQIMRPVKTACNDHMGSSWARIHSWDGKKWNMGSDWYQADDKVLDPLIKEQGDKYLADKKMTRRAECK